MPALTETLCLESFYLLLLSIHGLSTRSLFYTFPSTTPFFSLPLKHTRAHSRSHSHPMISLAFIMRLTGKRYMNENEREHLSDHDITLLSFPVIVVLAWMRLKSLMHQWRHIHVSPTLYFSQSSSRYL